MFTSFRRKMERSCSDSWIVKGGLKPPAVDKPWVVLGMVLALALLGLLCFFGLK